MLIPWLRLRRSRKYSIVHFQTIRSWEAASKGLCSELVRGCGCRCRPGYCVGRCRILTRAYQVTRSSSCISDYYGWNWLALDQERNRVKPLGLLAVATSPYICNAKTVKL